MFKEKKMFSICECLLHRNGKEKLFHSSPRRNFPGETERHSTSHLTETRMFI